MTNSHRYRQVITTDLPPTFRPPGQPDFARQVSRSMILEDIGPQPLVVAAVKEVFSRMSRQVDRVALLEAVSTDPVGALRQVLRQYRVGSPLRSLILDAIRSEEAAERAYRLERG